MFCGFELLLVILLRNIIVISNSEESNLLFSFPREHIWCYSQLWFKATCCSVTNQLPQSCFVFVTRGAKAWPVRLWNEAVI